MIVYHIVPNSQPVSIPSKAPELDPNKIDEGIESYFKNKGLMRSLGGVFSDLINFRYQLSYDRLFVLFGLKKDPYDNFT